MGGAQPDLPSPIFIVDARIFSYPIFRFSTIPLLHSAFKSRLHLSGVESKSGPLSYVGLFTPYGQWKTALKTAFLSP